MKKIVVVLIILFAISAIGSYVYIHNQTTTVSINNGTEVTKQPETVNNESKPVKKPEGTNIILNAFSRVIGVTVDGEWRGRDEIGKYIKGGEKYRTYSQARLLGEFDGGAPIEESYITGEKGYRIALKPETEELYDAAFSITGNWDPLPRVPVIKESGLDEYEPLIKDMLKKNGMPDAVVLIKQVAVADLDGDGTEEAIITASNYVQEDYDSISNGDFDETEDMYSMIVLQKTVDGVKKNIVISECYKKLDEYKLSFISDMDGDGVMEFLVREDNLEAVKAEGFSLSTEMVYDIVDGNPSLLFSVSSSPI